MIALLALAAFAPAVATRWFTAAKTWAANDAGWFTILAVAGFLVVVIGVAVSGYGRIKLGWTTVHRIATMAFGLQCCSLQAWASG